MFAAMCEYFINEIKISKDFYMLEYERVKITSERGIRKNSFGALVHLYFARKTLNDVEFFETDFGKNLEKHISNKIQYEEINADQGICYRIKIDKSTINERKNELNIAKANIEHNKFVQLREIHDNNAIVSLLIRFENFLTEYFKWLIQKYPDKYLSEKSIKYADLMKYDYNEMKEELINETADAIMSKPLNDWIKIMREHKYDFRNVSEYINQFKEIYYRRNLIVHNRGVVNRIYLDNVCGAKKNVKLGNRLVTNKEYVINAHRISMILVYGFLYASLKSEPSFRKDYLDLLFNNGFEHMLNEDWEISEFIYDVLRNDKNQEELMINISKINYWISCKNSGKFDEVREEIEKIDFSSMNVSLQMAKEILLERYDLAVPLIDKCIPAYLSADAVKRWPLFIQFRRTEYYNEFLKKYEQQLDDQYLAKEDMDSAIEVLKDENIKELELLFRM